MLTVSDWNPMAVAFELVADFLDNENDAKRCARLMASKIKPVTIDEHQAERGQGTRANRCGN
ncbi:hypothetical protein LF1_34990 [Rubripirellula obstinata]|uniref:Uncharacterized protein n=1 Tax=Rubripirellula obstinata TaxID=406547 RepID=A0A5B1CIB5_9BACT|nr:hypothetical protein LF1_34990 [Rubripirellula obstinata]